MVYSKAKLKRNRIKHLLVNAAPSGHIQKYNHLKSCINEANMGVGDRITNTIPHADAVLIR
jgi:hypothetical protein